MLMVASICCVGCEFMAAAGFPPALSGLGWCLSVALLTKTVVNFV
jgi:hypothetical protein